MGNIGDPITPSVPAVGSAGPQFATDINAILAEVVARLTAKVPLSSISTNSTLNMSGSPITNAGYMTLTDLTSTPGVSPVNRITTYQGNLWYVGPSGAIQLTSGATLNAASVGGITGDYTGAGPMQFRYTTATTRYDAYSNFGTSTFGYVRALGFDIAAGASSSFFARLLFAGAANKTYTLPPAAASAGIRPLYIDNAGQISVGYGSSKNYNFSVASSVNTGTPDFSRLFASGAGATKGGISNNTNGAHCILGVNGLPEDFVISSFICRCANISVAACTVSLVKCLNGTTSVLATGTPGVGSPSNTTFALGVAETLNPAATYFVDFVFDNSTTAIFDGVSVVGTLPT